MANSIITNNSDKRLHLKDTISLNGSCQIPIGHQCYVMFVLSVSGNNNVARSPIYQVTSSSNRIPLIINPWLAQEVIEHDDSTGNVSWTYEDTIVGTKSASWTIKAQVYYT